MSIAQISTVNITLTTKTPTQKGFGTPLIAAYHTHNTDRVRTYTDLNGMVADGYATTEPAYLAAAEVFAQTPRVVQLKIGRRANAWTQVIDLTPTAPSTGLVYSITIFGALVTYTALVTDTTVALACTGIAAAINAAFPAAPTAIIATGGSTTGSQTLTGASLNGATGVASFATPRSLEIVLSTSASWLATTGTVRGLNAAGALTSKTFAIPSNGGTTVSIAGLWTQITELDIPAQAGALGTFTLGFRPLVVADGSSGTTVAVTTQDVARLAPYQHTSVTSNLTFLDVTTDPGITADLNAIYLADANWYGLLLDSNSSAEALSAAAWAESNGMVIFCAQTCDTAVSDTAASSDTTSVAAQLKSAARFRTHLDFHPEIGLSTSFIAAGLMGNRLVVPPGSDTWVYKTLPGVSTDTYTSTQQTNLDAKNVGYYISAQNQSFTLGGMSASGQFMDVVRGRDWLVAILQTAWLSLLLNNQKIPYTDPGIDMAKGVVKGALGDAIRAGFIAASPAPTVTAPAAADVPAATRATRVLPSVNFGAQLAGAIHSIQINGSLSA